MRIKSGDKVVVLWGKDAGKTGKVLKVFPQRNKVSVEGVNLMVKHMRQRRENEKGQKIQFPAPFALDKIMLICPRCGRATRIGTKKLDNKKPVRVCKKCQETI